MGSEFGGPRLSLVVPVYGVEAFLAECLESMLGYPGDDIEVIAINDGSPDGCGRILDEYAMTDSRLRVMHLATNVGLVQARNAGLDHAVGQYVWFVDPDDWLPASAIERVLSHLAMVDVTVLVVGHAEVYTDRTFETFIPGDLIPGVATPMRLVEAPRLLRLAPSACTKIVLRSFLLELGLRFEPGWYEDSAFSIAILMAAPTIDVMDQVSYCYRRHESGSITTTRSDKHFGVFDQYERLFTSVERGGADYDAFRPELFRFMINHYLVILGNQGRLPDELRKAFFDRMVEHYARWLPAAGYDVPTGPVGLKHRLLQGKDFRLYVILRMVYNTLARPVWTMMQPRRSRLEPFDSLAPPKLVRKQGGEPHLMPLPLPPQEPDALPAAIG